MDFRVDEHKLKQLMQARGIASYPDLAAATGGKVHWRTLYNFATGRNWTRETLEAVCAALACKPTDLIPELGGESAHAHAAPHPTEEPEAVGTV